MYHYPPQSPPFTLSFVEAQLISYRYSMAALLSHLRSTDIHTPTIILLSYLITMTKSLITGSAPLKAWKDLVRLVFTAGYPFKTFINSPVGKIQLRTLNGRRRSYPCRVDLPRRVAKRASNSPRRSTTPSRKSPGVHSGRVAKRPQRRTTTFPKDVAESEPQGLYNPHSFCYRRALLQCLLHVPSLYEHFATTHTECNIEAGKCVACALKAFFHDY